jgi:hypothetical protein
MIDYLHLIDVGLSEEIYQLTGQIVAFHLAAFIVILASQNFLWLCEGIDQLFCWFIDISDVHELLYLDGGGRVCFFTLRQEEVVLSDPCIETFQLRTIVYPVEWLRSRLMCLDLLVKPVTLSDIS